MKKLITILTITMFLSSCRYETPKIPFIVEEINQFEDGFCKYESSKTKTLTHPFNIYWDACIIDSCGKFNVCDTVKLTK